MKKLLVLGCGLFLLSICTFNNNLNDNELIFSTIEENSKEGVTLRKAKSNVNVEVRKTYVQDGQNATHRMLRFATPVSGDFSSIKYHVSIEGYDEVSKDVSVVYKGIETNGTVSYYDGTDIVNEKTELTSSWYWACFTIEFSTYKFVDANISAYITVNESINSEAKENVTLNNQMSSEKVDINANLIGKWKNNNNNVEIGNNYLIINDYKLNYIDFLNDFYVFYNGVNYLKVKLDNNNLIVNGKLDVDDINLSLERVNLIKCPVTFEEKTELTVGDEEIKFTVPEGVKYTAYYEQNGKKICDYGTLPTEAGYYSLVVDTIENDIYEATHVWKTFKLNEKPSVEKETLEVNFDFEAGTKFALGIAPSFKIKNSEGNVVEDADISVLYTSESGYRSSELPVEPGDYGITVTINENDKYNKVSKNVWFTVENRIETRVTSQYNNIYSGELNNIIDGNKSTFCWFGGSFEVGQYIQLDYSYKKELNRLAYTFDTNDYFKFKVQYLNNGEYVDCSGEIDGSTGLVSFNSTVETTSIRFVCTDTRGGCWIKIYEMDLFFAPDVTNNGFTLVPGSDLNSLSDGSLDTYTWFDWHYTSNNNIVLDYGKVHEVKTITFLSGCSAHEGDVAGTMKFSYSEDGETYIDIDGVYEGINILVKLDTPVNARYIKAIPILEGESPSGITIREFGINLSKFNVSVTFGDDVAFTYDGEAHSPSYSVPYGVSYSKHYNSEDLKKFNQTEAKDAGFWAIVIVPEESEIYNFVGPLYRVFHIDATIAE